MLAAALPGIGATNRPASQQVRAQYESHPYPRWQAPPTPRPAALRALIASLPGIDPKALPPAPLATPIAACGTGSKATDPARPTPTLPIPPSDPSPPVLAYPNANAAKLGPGRIA